MRALSSIQLFGRASVHNGLVFSSSKNFSELGETAKTDLKDVHPLSCMLQTFHLQRLSLHVYSVLDILTKYSHRFCEIISVLDVERQFQCSVRQ